MKAIWNGDRTFKLGSDTTSEPGRYIKFLGEPRRGLPRCSAGPIGSCSWSPFQVGPSNAHERPCHLEGDP